MLNLPGISQSRTKAMAFRLPGLAVCQRLTLMWTKNIRKTVHLWWSFIQASELQHLWKRACVYCADYVWPYSHHTHNPTAAPAHTVENFRPESRPRRAGAKKRQAHRAAPFPPRPRRLLGKTQTPPRCQGRAAAQSVSTQLADCGTRSKLDA